MHVYGGIQSIIFRLSDYIVKNGDQVVIVTNKNYLAEHINNSVDVVIIDNYNVISIVNKINPSVDEEIQIITFAPPSMALGYLISTMIIRGGKSKVSLIQGVFHPRDFFRENEKKHGHYLNFILVHLLGIDHIFYMNYACRDSHQAFFKKDLKNANIIPIPIDSRPYRWQPTAEDCLRICSVGRIVPFKAYNFSAAEITDRLANGSCEVKWDIYGHGSHEELLRKNIKASATQSVRFCGSVNLDDFDQTVSSYDLFVGMGTAALQAAQLGVPTICAIDSAVDSSYGFMYNAPEGCVGEYIEGMQVASIHDTIKSYAGMNQSERLNISMKCRDSTLSYSVSAFFDGLCSHTKIVKLRFFNLPLLYARFYLWTMSDSLIRRVYRRIRRIGKI